MGGIRSRIVWLCISSTALTLVTIYIGRNVFRALVNTYLTPGPNVNPVMRFMLGEFTSWMRMWDFRLGFPVIPTLAGVVVFILYVVLLSRGLVRYMSTISHGVKKLSDGDFEHHIPILSNDELGQLAGNINHMARQWQASMEEERLAVQAKNDLVTNVSHDLRTPLTSVIGYLRLIEEDRYKDEVELRHYVNIAYEKSLRLGRLVNDLFDYMRMSYGQIPLNRSGIDLVALLQQLAMEFALPMQNADMTLNVTSSAERIPIQADGDKLMRVFENLISNSMKYGRDGKVVDVRISTTPESATVQVVNYGPSISASDLPYIFERFYRVDKSRSEESGGTGLGLAIVKNIVELHGGTVSATSDARETVFEVILPLSAAGN